MKLCPSVARSIVAAAFLFVLDATVAAQGPDVIVGDLTGPSSYGVVGGIAAYAVGTDSCNIGNQTLLWQGGTNLHPVIGQNAYRVSNNRLEQIGMSWLKHGFTALAGSLCNTCQNPGTGSLLGVGCSDPYSSGLNGTQSNLGPRSEVNAANGVFAYPFGNPGGIPSGQTIITRRLQIATADLGVAGATYFFEAQYVTQDDAAAGNKNNNASYRRATFGITGNLTASYSGSTVRQKCAVEAWKDIDAAVVTTMTDVVNDGRFHVGVKSAPSATPGYTIYNYAVENLSSDRSGHSFTVNFPAGTGFQNSSFRSPPYHSGEPYNNTAWGFVAAANGVSWTCAQTYGQNPNANALRWGTTFTFSVEATQAPTGTSIGLFKPAGCPLPYTYSGAGSYTLNNAAAYDFVNPATLANVGAGPTGDDTAVTVTLPFSFNFYGVINTQVQISSNGYLAMPGQDGTQYVNTAIPSAAVPNGFIGGLWDDLNPATGGTITYGTAGVAPNRRFVVYYNAVRFYGLTTTATLQIILNEGSGLITSTHVAGSAASATRGVENQGGTGGTQGSYNSAAGGTANTTWTYTPNFAVPNSASLTQIGNGLPNTQFGINLQGAAGVFLKPVIVALDTSAGPTSLGALGTLNLGFSPAFTIIIDGTGSLPSLDPTAATNACANYQFTINSGPAGIVGLAINAQAIIIDAASPNGSFHISTPLFLHAP